jgi:uncharacterized membrane protein
MGLVNEAALVIDWTKMPTYNTVMSVAAGAGLLSIVWLGWLLQHGRRVSLEGWAVNFGVLGTILTITGTHMTLTWPFAKYFPFDNIIFGETSLVFGVLLLGGAILLWLRRKEADDPDSVAERLSHSITPLSIIIIGAGLALGAIAFAGLVFQLFAAPPEEPISGAFAQWPWLEATFMSGLFGVTGIGTILFPFAVRGLAVTDHRTAVQWVTGIALGLPGLGFLLFGAMNFFTHIGLIIHTMG